MSNYTIKCFTNSRYEGSYYCNVYKDGFINFSICAFPHGVYNLFREETETSSGEKEVDVNTFVNFLKNLFKNNNGAIFKEDKEFFEIIFNNFGGDEIMKGKFPIKQTFIVNSLSFDTVEEAEKYRAELIEVLKMEKLAKKYKISVDKVKALREDFRNI